MTTGCCARILNAAAEEANLYTKHYIVGEIDKGRLRAEIDEPRGQVRQRRLIRVSARDFYGYVRRYHPDLLKDIWIGIGGSPAA